MNNLRNALIDLGHRLAEDREAAHDLWSWLPSHKVAERHHGDYAGEFQPAEADVMREAAIYLSMLRSDDQEAWRARNKGEVEEWFESCPCGDVHEEDEAVSGQPSAVSSSAGEAEVPTDAPVRTSRTSSSRASDEELANLREMGRKASLAGEPLGKNPYSCVTPEDAERKTAWDSGWVDGRVRGVVELEPEVARYSIEPHGPEGSYALYRGRSKTTHGLNLCRLSDFDWGVRGVIIRQLLEHALNFGLPLQPGPYSLKEISTVSTDGRFALFCEKPVLDRLCTLSDFDQGGAAVRAALLKGLNASCPPPLNPRPRTSADPLSVSCPLKPCLALPGEPCKKTTGDRGPRTEPHPERVKAAEEWKLLGVLEEPRRT